MHAEKSMAAMALEIRTLKASNGWPTTDCATREADKRMRTDYR